MPITSVLSQYVRSLARREVKPLMAEAKKRSAEHRRSIAALKRQIAQLTRELRGIRGRLPKQDTTQVPEGAVANARLRIDGLKAHRKRLGLSAADFGRLMGVSGLTVYNWEAGKSKPRRSQLPRIVSVRGIGKREALERLNKAG